MYRCIQYERGKVQVKERERNTTQKMSMEGELISMTFSASSAFAPDLAVLYISTAWQIWKKLSSDSVKCGWYIFLFCDIFTVEISISNIELTNGTFSLINFMPPTKSLYKWDEKSTSCSRACLCNHSLMFLDEITSLTT